MGWKLVGKPKSVEVTKKIVEEFATMDPAPSDRSLSAKRLEVYKKLMDAGQFRPVTWASAFCKETGGTYRVNGKHTSVMLAAQTKLPCFYAIIEHYECDTLEDVARLYATFDSKMQARTARDINLSFAGTVDGLEEVSGRIINHAVVGMSYHKWMDSSYTIQPVEKAELILEYPEFILWFNGVCGVKFKSKEGEARQGSRHLCRAGVIAAMFRTWQKSPNDAATFWTAVRDETGSSPEVPDRRLAKFLFGVTTGGNIGATSRKKAVSVREMLVKSLQAWNAWRKDRETVELRYYADSAIPDVG